MKMNVTELMFIDAFGRAGRENQFTRDGLIALYDCLCDLENDAGEEMELDVIGLCCDYSQYTNAALIEEFSHLIDADLDLINDESDEDEIASVIIEALKDETIIIECDDGTTIIQNF